MRLLLGSLCAVLALGSGGGAAATSSTPLYSETTYLIQDQDTGGPHPALTFPDSDTLWAGPAGWRVWYRVSPDKPVLQVLLYTGAARPNPDPLVAPGPDWSPATTWYLRTQTATTVLIVAADRGNLWGHATAGLRTTWDATTGLLTVTLP